MLRLAARRPDNAAAFIGQQQRTEDDCTAHRTTFPYTHDSSMLHCRRLIIQGGPFFVYLSRYSKKSRRWQLRGQAIVTIVLISNVYYERFKTPGRENKQPAFFHIPSRLHLLSKQLRCESSISLPKFVGVGLACVWPRIGDGKHKQRPDFRVLQAACLPRVRMRIRVYFHTIP